MFPDVTAHPPLCSRIVYWASSRPADLASLCRTCKVFQQSAEAKLYQNLMFLDPTRAYLACRAVILQSRYGSYVRVFWFTQESRRQPQHLSNTFWTALQDSLSRMPNLEILHLSDSTFNNSWILDPSRLKFQLHEAKLRLPWDRHLVNFLQSQRKLRVLQIIDQMDDVVRLQIQPSTLPFLQVFDGNLMIALQFLACPLTHLQIDVDMEAPQVLKLLPRLALVQKTLRSLNILGLPDEVAIRALDFIAKSCPLLRHIGTFPYPIINRQRFYYILMHIHYLRTIELDIHRWQPLPSPAGQRALAAEIRMYRPTTQQVVFWVGQARIRWILQGEDWIQRIENNQYSHSNLWAVA
ncbi:hypothetical protein AMATHDRAFT_55015 [Amanita thiersii Skay4041]|uniref:F-box domain-containing protein n=1 Tax=Amanita thiersii Skay4041 TaxID=703135 RepID=A0A2A9NZ31_9AGAR|nr:hypothetical protein AMATHDRAFT_55015 [Amanita thiersii Skay4041]